MTLPFDLPTFKGGREGVLLIGRSILLRCGSGLATKKGGEVMGRGKG